VSLSRMSKFPFLLALLAIAALLAACSEKSDDSSSADSSSGTTSLADCTPDQLDTVSSGKLTISTDKPAYPPYFEDNDPTNGKGFESAVGYAIGDKLGFTPDQIEWTVEPFNASYSPGPKDFDFDLNQISITPKRAEQVDFSSPYYTADQAVVALPGTLPDDLTTTGDLADAKIGVQIGTTSLDAVTESIDPSEDPQVFDTSNDVVTALEQGQVDAIVVDTPTALYLTAAQVPDAKIYGEFPAPGGDEWGALLQKGSSRTGCVSAAVDELKSSGELEKIQQQWINAKGGVPTLG
jgi:polar amino acid transport system substrate-binding protein